MLRAIIADDEETIRNGLKNLIESSQLDIVVIATAEDGQEALAVVNEYSPEIILMDINMPHLNGLQAIEKVKSKHQHAKIIIISGYDEFEYAHKAIELGVFAYLLKPLDYRNLIEVLQEAVKSYSQRIWELNQLKVSSKEMDCYKAASQASLAALDYIRENYTDNNISLVQVANQFHISQSYLTKAIKHKTGNNFTDYVNRLRISTAIHMLTDKDKMYTINEISSLVGYSSQHYFSRAFKNYAGVSPNKYRSGYPSP
ncbi:response regulator transcription factor [Brevibacillus daliensis]|uniref:response regulator transcription factor n=1 Tax=Brevibacillus daliensis TaxID=2892995 RepID=UPI001E6127BE|nr:response regulator [Brevibacillus daliensis]